VRESPDNRGSDAFDRGVRNLSNAGIGGALLGAPFVVLAAIGSPSWVLFAYLGAAVVALGVAVARKRLRSR
jgi:hypothetical protein